MKDAAAQAAIERALQPARDRLACAMIELAEHALAVERMLDDSPRQDA